MKLPLAAHQIGRWVTRRCDRVPGMWRLRHLLVDHERVKFACHSVDVQLCNGTLITVDPNDLIGRTIFYQGLWEAPVAKHFVRHLRSGDTVLDVGANLGQFTLLGSSAVGPNGRVIAVEASHSMATRMKKNVEQNKLANVSVIEMAAWDCEDTLWLDSGVSGNAGMAAVHEEQGVDHKQSVRAGKLDDALQLIGVEAVDVMKIDIEGAEFRAFQGFQAMLTKHPPRIIYCEVGAMFKEAVAPAQYLADWLQSRGYSGRIVNEREERKFTTDQVRPGFMETVVFNRQ